MANGQTVINQAPPPASNPQNPPPGSSPPYDNTMGVFGLIALIVLLLIGAGIIVVRRNSSANSPIVTIIPTPTPTAVTTPTPTATPNPTQGTSVSNVSIKNFAFSPATLTVPAGTTVIWTNNDTVDHSVNAATFNSQVLHPGDTFSYTFTQAGTYPYTCGIHPNMTGQIIVR